LLLTSVTATVMLPPMAPLGSDLDGIRPVVGNVDVGRVKLAALDVDEVSDVPSGLSSVTVTREINTLGHVA
jgi:hypothetical protein